MTRNEFLAELKKNLQSLAEAEQEEALRYYEEYFDDAGPENEERVIEELGSPEELARSIIANSTFSLTRTSEQQQEKQSNGQQQFRQMGPEVPKKSSGESKALFWILLILTSIIWVPILFGVVMAILGLLFAVLITAVGLAIACIALLICAFVALIVGVPLVVTSAPDGLLLIGMALQYFGGLMLIGALTILCIKYLIPWAWKQCKRFFLFLRKKCRELM